MNRFFGLIGIAVILAIAYAMSNNRKAISLRIVLVGLTLQWAFAVFILKVPLGQKIFHAIGAFITMLLGFSSKGAEFVFGVFAQPAALEKIFGVGTGFIFAFSVAPTIIFMCALIGILYHVGIMQRVVAFMAKVFAKLMNVSGSEALSNTASIFVGQIEAQIMIQPYVSGMTMSELLASMSGSMACIAGGIMAVYIALGIHAEYLLAASLMSVPGAFVIAKIVWPETEPSQTKGMVTLEVRKQNVNLIDAAAHGCASGVRVAVNVVAMLIGFLALVALLDWFIGILGSWIALTGWDWTIVGLNLKALKLSSVLGAIFAPLAFLMGVPAHDVLQVGSLLGTKLVLNEFVAYLQLADIVHGVNHAVTLAPKSVTIATFALCGFANFSSIAMQIGGIGALAPSRKHDLATLGIKALICGTMASYVSATVAGIILG